jgi:PAS domain S-box-containing protein
MKKSISRSESSTKTEPASTSEQLERYKLLVDSVQDYAIFLLTNEGNVASWNKGAERFKGYTPDQIIGKHFSTFYTDRDKKANRPAKELETAVSEGRVEDEGWRVRKDGTKFWANVVITALFDTKGTLKGFAKVTRDLTVRKKHEDDLKEANRSLKRHEAELISVNKTKDEFMSLASHQLRTPATGVKQYIGMLLEGFAGKLTDQQYDILQRAYDSNDRQIATVNDLLRVAQVDAGSIVLNKVPTDLIELIEDVIDEQADSFKKRKQRLIIEKPASIKKVIVDDIRLRMAIENLVDNASKYTKEGGTINISIYAIKEMVHIDVRDTGVGIQRSDIPKLFTKFFRIPNKLSSAQNGSGLGLYWAKKVVELHGGELSVTSILGTGSVFSITIPQGSSKDV